MAKIKYHETYTYVEMEEVKLSAGGRIVIPKKMRKALRVEEGDGLLISLEGRRIVITSASMVENPRRIVITSASMVENPVERLYGSVKVAGKNPEKEGR